MGKSTWYVEDCRTQVVEPLKQEEILRRWLRGSLPDETRCWREGMSRWLPLAEAEPLASVMLRLRQDPSLIHFYCDCGNQISMSRRFAGHKVKCRQCGTIHYVPTTADRHVHVTRDKVVARIAAYLQQQLTLQELADWAERQIMQEGKFDSSEVRDAVVRLGLSDISRRGFTWEDCQSLLSDLGCSVHVDIVQVVE